MRLAHLRFNVIIPSLKILNDLTGKHLMNSHQAQAMLVAIALQESAAKYRRQIGGGPARGWWQFEKFGATAGVLRHSSTGAYALALLDELGFDTDLDAVWDAMPYSELLAAGFARLLLWSDARPLPAATPMNEEDAWAYYIRNWRPGRPHRDRWGANWNEALRLCGDF